MNITRVLLATALAAGLGATTVAAAEASVVVTIDLVNNNASTTIYHAKNPPSTQSDSFSPGRAWTVTPPDSIAAGGSDATSKITLGANEFVQFTFGSPNSALSFLHGCTMRIQANQLGTGLLNPSVSKIASTDSCVGNLPTGQPYNVKLTISGF